jgi:Helix-turn-helix.
METTKEVIVRAELPKLMRAVREALGLSQQQLAKLSGISRQMISYYETADAIPSIETFNKWLGAITAEIKKLRGGV